MSTGKRRRSRRSSEEDDEDEVVQLKDPPPSSSRGRVAHHSDSDDEVVEVQFSQQAPEPSQPIFPVKPSEMNNLTNMSKDAKQKAVTDLSRLLLFKALAGEPIDRLKITKEALADFKDEKIASAAFEQAAGRLSDVFGFDLCRVPKFMEDRKNFPAKFKDRYYLINGLADDESGSHSKAIHSVHTESSVEKGLLMVILAFAFCKGDPRGDGSRWISDRDLYRLLNGLDENIPAEPPVPGNRKSSTPASRFNDGGGVSQTPDVDALIDKFVHMDYLLKDKDDKEEKSSVSQSEDKGFIYSMGPKAALEIGRKQVVYFCAEILEEAPDPTMLAELEEGVEMEEVA